MTSDDVLKILRKSKKWMTSREIQIKGSLSRTSVNNSLRSSYKSGLIFKKEKPAFPKPVPTYKAK